MSTTYFDNLEFYEDVNLIEVDGVELTDVTSDSYTFTTAGNHEIGFSFAYGNIPERMFENVDDIIAAYINEDVYVVESYAFCNSSLSYAYLPSTIAYINSYAFYDTNISYMQMLSYTPPKLGDNVFSTPPTVISVPVAYTDDYRDAEGWSDYQEEINPSVPKTNYVITAYNVTTAPTQVKLWSDNSNSNNIQSIKVDGVELAELTKNYTFTTTGRHEIKYKLVDDTQIVKEQFNGCGITEVYIPDSIINIYQHCLNDNNLTQVTVPENVTYIGSNFCLLNKQINNIVIKSKGSLRIADGFCAFNNQVKCNLTIPQGLTSVGGNFYVQSKKPDYVSLLVTNMDTLYKNQVFSAIRSQMNLPIRLVDENLNEIFDISIPNEVGQSQVIQQYAFSNCSRLQTITSYAYVPPTLGSNSLDNCTALQTIYVPYAYVNDYKSAHNWNYPTIAAKIQPIERALTDSEFSWSSSSATTQSIGSYVGPTLINSYNLPVTYASSNQSIATINSSGQVTTLAYGSTTISATFAGDSSYQPKTVNYSLTVENAQPQPQSSYYVEYQIKVGPSTNTFASGNYLEPSAFYEIDPNTGDPVIDENTGNNVFDINIFNSMISAIYIDDYQHDVEDEEDLYYEYSEDEYDVVYTVRIVLPTATVPGTPFMCLNNVGDVTISQGITTIGGAFQNIYDSAGWTCHLPSTITTIENYSFYDNYTLKSITIDATTPPSVTGYDPEMGEDAQLWNQGTLIYVPVASEATYRNTDPWYNYDYYYNIYWDIEYSMYIDSNTWSEGDMIDIWASVSQQERYNPDSGDYEYGYYWLKLARISNNMNPDSYFDITEGDETNQYTLTQDDIDSSGINVKICLVNPTSTPEYLFNEVNGPYDITVNNRVSTIGNSSFSTSAASSIYLPSTITSFGDYSFSSNNLDVLTILSTTPPTFGQHVFDNTNITDIYVPHGSVQQYISAFTTAGYTDLASVVEGDPNEDPEEYVELND